MAIQNAVRISAKAIDITTIFIAQRLLDISERQGTNLTLVLLDWKQAFDKIDQRKLVEVLRRLNIPDVIIKAIENIYREANICVTKGDNFPISLRKIQTSDKDAPFHHISLVWL